MPLDVTFFVEGIPKAKGNHRPCPIGKGRGLHLSRPGRGHGAGTYYLLKHLGVRETTKGLGPWTRAIEAAAIAVRPPSPIPLDPFEVEVVFYTTRPQKPKHPTRVVVKPDPDKLARALLDPLTGIIWKDDCQVTDLVVRKRYGDVPGARVRIVQISEQGELF